MVPRAGGEVSTIGGEYSGKSPIPAKAKSQKPKAKFEGDCRQEKSSGGFCCQVPPNPA
jgi:hypothetical protein